MEGGVVSRLEIGKDVVDESTARVGDLFIGHGDDVREEVIVVLVLMGSLVREEVDDEEGLVSGEEGREEGVEASLPATGEEGALLTECVGRKLTAVGEKWVF